MPLKYSYRKSQTSPTGYKLLQLFLSIKNLSIFSQLIFRQFLMNEEKIDILLLQPPQRNGLPYSFIFFTLYKTISE